MLYKFLEIKSVNEFYWNNIGDKLAGLFSLISNNTPFIVFEVGFWLDIILILAAIGIILKIIVKRHYTKKNILIFLFLILFAYITCLIFYGALTTKSHPTFLTEKIKSYNYSEEELETRINQASGLLLKNFNVEEYKKISDEEILKEFNLSLDNILDKLSLQKGNSVKRIKYSYGFTTYYLISFSYLTMYARSTHEIIMMKPPYSPVKYQKILSIGHCSVFARGFHDRVEVDVLTNLALRYSNNRILKAIGYADFIYFSHRGIRNCEKNLYPEYLVSEYKKGANNWRNFLQLNPPMIGYFRYYILGFRGKKRTANHLMTPSKFDSDNLFFKYIFKLENSLKS